MSEPITWTNGRLRIGDLEPREDNPRQSTKKQVARIKQSVNDFGQVDILAVGPQNDKGKYPLYNGHQRYYAWLDEFGPDYMVDVRISNRPLKTEEWQALTITLHAGATGGWDWDKLPSIDTDILEGFGLLDADLLKGWQQDYFALGEMLAASETENEGKDTEPQVLRADELQQVWQVQLGDLWQCGPHRIICGDCTDRAVVERVMGGEGVDCSITDPPYGVGVDYGSFKDVPENVIELIKRIMPIIFEHLPAAFTPGIPMMWDYPRPTWVGAWVHPAPVGSCPWGFVGNNPILYYGNDPYLKSGKGRRPDCIVMASDRQGQDSHPTSKPLKVWEWLIERLTPKSGMIVFDPFLGSGTTLISCHNLNRRCRGIELHPPYVAVCLDRFKRHTGIEPIRLAPAQP